MEGQQNDTARHLLAVGVVAVIGLAGLVMMFREAGPTGQVTELKISSDIMTGCNAGEVKLTSRGVAALQARDVELSGAGVYYIGAGQYCADAEAVRAVFG